MRRILPVTFPMPYKITFSTNILRHNVYKSLGKPEKSKKLDFHKVDYYKASMYGNHAIGVYKQEKDSTLVDHVPIDCSTLVDNFLNTGKENRLTAVVTGKRKRHVATILHIELEKKKKKYRGHFELSSVEYNRKMHPSILQRNIGLFHNFIVLPIIAANKRRVYGTFSRAHLI